MILIISTCAENLNENEFVKPIANIVGEDFEVKHYSQVESVEGYEKIIICGTALKDNEFLESLDKFIWLLETERSVLGICSGMQIIALSFGAELTEANEIGMSKIKVLEKNTLFSEDLDVYELHGNSLTGLDQFDILAETSESVQAIRHKEKKFYGIIFHPEVRNQQVVKNFLEL
jgi:GMP synthase (glutamine-hydrolysing)